MREQMISVPRSFLDSVLTLANIASVSARVLTDNDVSHTYEYGGWSAHYSRDDYSRWSKKANEVFTRAYKLRSGETVALRADEV